MQLFEMRCTIIVSCVFDKQLLSNSWISVCTRPTGQAPFSYEVEAAATPLHQVAAAAPSTLLDTSAIYTVNSLSGAPSASWELSVMSQIV